MHRRISLALVLALICTFSLAPSATADTGPTSPQGWVTLMTEDFEGAFPTTGWHIGRTGDPYVWGKRNCNPHTGFYSMMGHGGGSAGSAMPCGSEYPTDTPVVTTLSYGPMDLSDCTDLRVNLAQWSWLGIGDSFGVGFSVDGGHVWHMINWYATPGHETMCDGWCEWSVSEDRWTTIDHICGYSNVYLVFRFSSNGADVGYGTFLDDVSFQAHYGAPGPQQPVYMPFVQR